MNRWPDRLSLLRARIASTVARFPITIVLFAALTLNAILPFGPGFESKLNQLDDYEGLVAAGVLPLGAGAMFSLAGALFAEARGWGRGAGLAVAALFGLIGFALLRWNVALGVYFGSVLPGIVGAVFVAPFVRRGTSDGFWRFVLRLMRAAMLAGMVALILAGGANLPASAAGAVIDVPKSAQFRIWAVAALFVAPLVGLAMIPRNFDVAPALDENKLDVSVFRSLCDIVMAPFVLIYAALLHVHALRVLFSGNLPEGATGSFVSGFGIALIAVIGLTAPIAPSGKWPLRLLHKVWPLLLPVPVILLATAGWERIAAVGMTPDRYLFLLFGACLAAIGLLQLRPATRGDIRYLAIVPVAALLAASFGPHGALATSIRSQTTRFKEMVKVKSFTLEEARSARTALYFLDRYYAMGPVLPPNIPATDIDGDTALRARVASAYGLDKPTDKPPAQ